MPELWALLVFAGQVGAYLGVGSWTLRRLGLRDIAMGVVFPLGVGLGVIGSLILVLGCAGMFGRPAALGLLAAGWALFVVELGSAAHPYDEPTITGLANRSGMEAIAPQYAFLVTRDSAKAATIGQMVLVAFFPVAAALVLIPDLIGALAPPSGVDALAYHLAIPKLWLQQGRITHLPTHFFSDGPALMEMHFLWSLALGSDRAPALLQWGLAAATAGTIAVLPWQPSNYRGASMGCAAALLFLATPMVTWEAANPFNDLGIVFLSLLAARAFLVWQASGDRRTLRVCGLLLGFCCAVKMTAVLIVAPWVALVVWQSRRPDNLSPHPQSLRGGGRRLRKHGIITPRSPSGEEYFTPRHSARSLADVFLPAVLAAIPWYLRTWLDMNNPVWPLGYAWLGGREWNSELDRLLRMTVTNAYGFGRSPLSLLLLPWNLTVHGVRFDAGRNGFGPAYLLLVPAVLLARSWRDRLWAAVGAACAGATLLWFAFSSQQGRFLLPVLPLACLLYADAMCWLQVKHRAAGLVGAVVLCGHVAFGAAVAWGYNAQFARVVFHRESPDEFLARKAPFYTVSQRLNRTLPPGSRVLIEYSEGYYLDVPYLKDGILQGAINYSRLRSPAELETRLRQLDTTHVLYAAPASFGELGPSGSDPYVARIRRLHAGLRAKMVRVWTAVVPVPIGRTAGAATAVMRVALFRLTTPQVKASQRLPYIISPAGRPARGS